MSVSSSSFAGSDVGWSGLERLSILFVTWRGLRFLMRLIGRLCSGFEKLELPGVLPKVVAADVNQRGNFALRYYDVSRRILRMNKRLHFETGKCLFEKRGHAWALTRFAFDSYDEPIEPENEVSTAGSEEGLGHEKEEF